MDDHIDGRLVGKAEQFEWISPQLWSDTPHGAVHRAVEAQPHTVWRQLWQQALADCAPRSPSPCALAGTSELEASTAGTDSGITVAAFVLSAPFMESRYTEDKEAKGPISEVSIRRYVCISLGSGSRCLPAHDTPASHPSEKMRRMLELRDGHAEVMARRGFIACLMDMADASTRHPDGAYANPFLQSCHMESNETPTCSGKKYPQWALRDAVAVHLVCTRWMCGSLAAVAGGSGRSGHLLLRAACGCWLSSGAQSEVSAHEGNPASPTVVTHVASHCLASHYSPLNEAASFLHAARVKPGRGRPNLSMSCTDKVWRWSVLGVQGRRRASLFPVPMQLSSIHILHTPFEDSSHAHSAAAHAATTFQWRSSRWCPPGGSGVTPPPTPKLSFFTSAELVAPDQLSDARLHRTDMPNDSSYSRSRWLCTKCGPATRKRSRHDETLTSTNFVCTWQCCPSTDSHSCFLVLNTKAGLPQGMTTNTLLRRCGASAELPWKLCPLSRPWMAQRMQQLQLPCKETALIFPSTMGSPDLSLCVHDAISELRPLMHTPDRDCLCMGQRMHCHHLQYSSSAGDATRLLWASSSPTDDPELSIKAHLRCKPPS